MFPLPVTPVPRLPHVAMPEPYNRTVRGSQVKHRQKPTGVYDRQTTGSDTRKSTASCLRFQPFLFFAASSEDRIRPGIAK